MIYYGVISEVKGTKARAAVDGFTTDYLPVFQIANSYKRNWTPIREKEQCAVFAPFGDINTGCIMRGLYYSGFPAPGTDPEQEITEYSDGTKISYRTTAGKGELKIDAVRDMTIICGETVNITCTDAKVTAKNSIKAECKTAELAASGSVLVKSPSVDIGGTGGTGVVTQECICTITGLPHPEASKIVRAVRG